LEVIGGSAATCTTAYSSQSVIHLSIGDHDRSITTHLCYEIHWAVTFTVVM